MRNGRLYEGATLKEIYPREREIGDSVLVGGEREVTWGLWSGSGVWVCGLWSGSVVCDLWFVVCGLWYGSVVCDLWFVVCGLWSAKNSGLVDMG